MNGSFITLVLFLFPPVLIPAQQVSDPDGNTYATIKMGTQEWLKENLKTTRFSDGTPLPEVTSASEWEMLEAPGYSWYDNGREKHGVPYGALYNWYALDPETNGGKNVCPAGWHVPSENEWRTLEDLLDEGFNMAGSKMKSDSLWSAPEVPVVKFRKGVEMNSSGFAGLPGGMRDHRGNFWGKSYYGFWWSSTQSSKSAARARGLIYNTYTVSTFNGRNKKHGLSVRCVKD